jgi:hypothetical protein
MDIDMTMILLAMCFTMALAPAMAIIWIFIAKMGIELFSPADVQALEDKANPVLVPGTTSTQSSQGATTTTKAA